MLGYFVGMQASYLRRAGYRGRLLVEGQRGVYHVMSRTACGQYLFDDEAKAVFVKMLRKQAGFCGVDVLAYCVMGNHFHLLVAVPEDVAISDAELLRRYRLLYREKGCPPSSASPSVLAKLLAANEEAGQALRAKILARMHDLSVFMRELKQRFGIWFNHRHENKGTIWAKRFTSVVVEPSREALTTVAAYIDLNPVRAELVADPEDYAFSSYGAAVRGRRPARQGYELVFCREVKWATLLPSYRLILYGKGAVSKGVPGKDHGRISGERLEQVQAAGGKLPLSDVLRLRVRYFTAGTAIGSDRFLTDIGVQWKRQHGLERKRDAYPMRSGEWGKLRCFRNLQVDPVGTSR
jgi:REP element-mobilizing transposase RayT